MTVHLHVRSANSLLESTVRINEYTAYAAKQGAVYAALTDHNVLHGAAAFLHACRSNGLKPIIGMETDCMYHDQIIPFLLLAKDNAGYRELIRLSSLINDGRGYCLMEEMKQYSSHCFIIAYGEGGWFDSELIAEDAGAVAEKIRIMRSELGEFDVALSYQEASLWKMKNDLLRRICARLSVHTCALNKIYYLKKEDAAAYRIVCGIRTQKTLQDQTLPKVTGRYYLTNEEMASLYTAEDLRRTDEIAEGCLADFELTPTSLPAFPVPSELTSEQYLTQLCLAGLRKRTGGHPSAAYASRLKYELSVIAQMHFEDYFLIVYDFIRYARTKDIYIGPGRGSAAGSLVAYCLGITQVDPLKYHLLFERFLNPERVSMPDIDTDIPDNRRQEVISYVYEKYGEDHVANIVTFGTLGARQVIRDVGKVMNIPQRDIDLLSKTIPAAPGMTLAAAMKQSTRLRELVNAEPKYKTLFEESMKLEGLPRHASVHAAGIALSRLPLQDIIPTMRLNEGIRTSQFTAEYLEERGLIKMDFLGLRNLTIIDDIVTQIKAENPEFQIMAIPLDDRETYRVFEQCDTTGIFQFESEGMKNLIRKMKPSCFEDVVAALALFRPASMESIPLYLENKANPAAIKYPAEVLKPVLAETYGVMVYQEQAMITAELVAGFSLGRADVLRKAMSKKKEKDLEALRDEFMRGSLRNGYTQETAEQLFDLVSRFGGYGFNKSHAVAYGLIAYQMAYLKANYPDKFYASLLNSVIGDENKTAQYIDECRRRGITVQGPDVTASTNSYTASEKGLLMPIAAVKGVGFHAGEIIIAERSVKPFEDFFDFVSRCAVHKISRRIIESLIGSGALDAFGYNRTTLLGGLDDALNYADLVRIEQDGQISINLGLVSKPMLVRRRDIAQEISENEKKALGFYFGPHPIVEMRREYNIHLPSLIALKNRTGPVEGFAMIDSVREHRTRKGDLMAFVKLMDETDELNYLVMPRLYAQKGNLLTKGRYIMFRGKMQEDASCIADSFGFLNEKER